MKYDIMEISSWFMPAVAMATLILCLLVLSIAPDNHEQEITINGVSKAEVVGRWGTYNKL